MGFSDFFRNLFRRESRAHPYDGGSWRQPNSNWLAPDGPGENLNSMDRDVIRARTRGLERNSDMTAAIIEVLTNNVVGSGYRMRPKITGENERENAELNKTLEALWLEWSEFQNCDMAGLLSFSEMLEKLVTRRLVDGGLFFVFCNDASSKFGLKLQILEVDSLDTSVISHGKNRVLNGVELNEYGRHIAYHFKIFDCCGWSGKSKRVPAGRVIYIAHRQRVSEVREISPLARILGRLRDFTEYLNTISVKERVLACLSVIFKRKNVPANGYGRRSGEAGGNNSGEAPPRELSPGMISYLGADEDAVIINPVGQAVNAREFATLLQRNVGASMGLSYEAASRDMSQVNYSSARQGLIEDHKTYRRTQEYVINHFCVPVYREFVKFCALNGLVKIPDFFQNRQKYTKCQFIPNGMPWIDPVKEVNANRIAMETGQTTLEAVCAAAGRDWRETLLQLSIEKKYKEDLGLIPKEGLNAAKN